MVINYKGSYYQFRECDTKNITAAELIAKAEKGGALQYEPRNVWLVVPGVGYGLRVDR